VEMKCKREQPIDLRFAECPGNITKMTGTANEEEVRHCVEAAMSWLSEGDKNEYSAILGVLLINYVEKFGEQMYECLLETVVSRWEAEKRK